MQESEAICKTIGIVMSITAARAARSTYSSAIVDAREYTGWILDLFAGSIRGRIAEIGIGHGSYAHRLADRSGYTGIDIDPVAVEEARARMPSGRFVVADIARRDAMQVVGFELLRQQFFASMCWSTCPPIAIRSPTFSTCCAQAAGSCCSCRPIPLSMAISIGSQGISVATTRE